MAKYNKELVMKFLDDNGYKYEKIEHKPLFTMDEYFISGVTKFGEVAKNLFLRNYKGDKHYLVVIKSDKQPDTKKLAISLGSTRLSFASAKRLDKYLGVTQGSVSPLAILNDENHEVVVAIDSDIMGLEKIGVHPCENTATCFINVNDIKQIIEKKGNKVIIIKI